MVVIINGAFGVGKSTVVAMLRRRLDGSKVFDPEHIGSVLRCLPSFFPPSTRGLDDYQDSSFWRSMTVRLAGWKALRRRLVLLPMCFSNLAYLIEIRAGLESRGGRVLHFCLTATEATIGSRLRRRGVDPDSDEGRWVYPRSMRACALHCLPDFAVQIPTEDRTPDEVADDICSRIERVA